MTASRSGHSRCGAEARRPRPFEPSPAHRGRRGANLVPRIRSARRGGRDGTGREGVTRNERIDIILETTLLRRSGSVRFGSGGLLCRERERIRERGKCVRCAIKKRDGNEARGGSVFWAFAS